MIEENFHSCIYLTVRPRLLGISFEVGEYYSIFDYERPFSKGWTLTRRGGERRARRAIMKLIQQRSAFR